MKTILIVDCATVDVLYDKYHELCNQYPSNTYRIDIDKERRSLTIYGPPFGTELVFAPIDTKDGFTGYKTVGVFNYAYKGDATPHSFHNYKVQNEATLEYLEKLDKLQKDIKYKYEPRLVDDSSQEEFTWEELPEDYEQPNFSSVFGHLYYT